jgi:ribonuclease HI
MRRLIVEADGGSRGNPGIAAGGSIVIDEATGEVLAEIGVYVGVASNNVAEYSGMIAGVRRALAIDPNAELRIRLDSKLVVEQMSGRWKIKHPDMANLAAEKGKRAGQTVASSASVDAEERPGTTGQGGG